MLKQLSQWLLNTSNGWVAMSAFVIFILFTALVLPRQAASSESRTAGAGSPDTSFFYTPQDLYSYAQSYGEAGRTAYVQARFTFDLVWPVVYAFFFSTSISWLYANVLRVEGLWSHANLVPILGMLFDYLENISTSLVMLRFPESTPFFDWLAPVFTLVKWVLVFSSFALLLGALLIAVWRRVRRLFSEKG